MKERLARLKAIKKLIKNFRIESQETLLGYLQKDGYVVTQATLSRDLKLLKVGKVSDGHNGYYYTLPGDEERKESEKSFIQDFLRGYISVEYNQNMVVIKTFSGHSDSVALAVDNLALEEVLGTVSGRDNTVLVVLREGFSGEDFLNQMKDKIPEMEE